MFDWRVIFGFTAGVIAFLACGLYILSILRGKTAPSKATWWIWSLVQIMLSITFWQSARDSNAIWVSVGYTAGAIATAFLTIKYGESGWDKTDKYCLLLSFVAIGVWISTNATFALLGILLADILGAIPTVKKSYLEPWKEDLPAWGLGFSSNVINIFVLGSLWRLDSLYPIYLLLMTGMVVIVLFIRRKFVAPPKG
ncbi:MAG: hypothetical protein HYV76_02005 [Candidatus Vogelbacteria bacterium]|nr:hypothetical protein [Candidatus Vogelbacteria bacterium]